MRNMNYVDGMKQIASQLGMDKIISSPLALLGGMADLLLSAEDIRIMRTAMNANCAATLLKRVRDMQGSQQDYQSQKDMLIRDANMSEASAHRVLVGVWAMVGKDAEGYKEKNHDDQVINVNNNSTQKKARAPRETPIDTYEEYKVFLREYYVYHGKRHLTTDEIRQFVEKHYLDCRWGITIEDVQKDLESMCYTNAGLWKDILEFAEWIFLLFLAIMFVIYRWKR